MKTDQIETPAVLIETDTLKRNLRRMAEYCRSHQLSLRPHTKTHKIPEIAKRQVECGATGITVAKLAEAEVMADAGIQDIVIVYPLWGESKWRRLTALAERIRIAVTMDSLPIAEGTSKSAKQAGVEVGIRLEFDTGFGRCGLPIQASSVEAAQMRSESVIASEWSRTISVRASICRMLCTSYRAKKFLAGWKVAGRGMVS